MRTRHFAAPRRGWLLAACLAAACTREQPPPADTAAAALPAARACLAVDTVLVYDNQDVDDPTGDPSGERIVFRRAGGRWSGIARNFYSPEDSLVDSLTIVPATGAIRFILWPRSGGPVEFRGTIDCDSIAGTGRSIRSSNPPIADVYHSLRWLETHEPRAATTRADTVAPAPDRVGHER